MLGVAVVLAGFSLIALLLTWSRWLAGRRWAAGGHVLMAVCAGWGALLLGSVQSSLASYEPVHRAQPVAELYVEQTGSGRFRGTLTRLPAGQVQVFELTGDQWRLEARTLDWQGRAAQLGLRPRYRLERLSTRLGARSSAPEPGKAPEVSTYALVTDSGDDLWAKARTRPAWTRHLRGGHADGPWRPLANGARFSVRLESQALRVDPANEAAAASLKPAR